MSAESSSAGASGSSPIRGPMTSQGPALPSGTSGARTRAAGPSLDAEFPVDPESPLFVAEAVVASAIAGGAMGALLGWKRRHNPWQMGVNMSINCGIAALAFFGTREYLVSPILLGARATPGHARRGDELRARLDGDKPPSLPPASLWDVRTDRLLDSAIAGALSAGGISVFTRGPRTLLPAAFTAALLATAAQGAVNQARVVRLNLLARGAVDVEGKQETAEEEGEAGVAPIDARASMASPRRPASESRGDAPITARILSALSRVLPVRKLDDDEYLASLEKQRADVERRIAEIDAEQLDMWTKAGSDKL